MNYIHTVLELLSHPENQNFRWNCETWFCVEKFLEEATPQEAQALFEHMKAGRVGFSATYLNFCDLVDSQVLHRRREAQRRYALARRLEPPAGGRRARPSAWSTGRCSPSCGCATICRAR